MASPSAGRPRRARTPPAPLDEARLQELALSYVARFATSAGRLRAYCRRKLRERGYAGAEEGRAPPDVEGMVARMVAKGYVDDVGFARAKTGSLLRRGYGARRVGETLRADGIAEPLRADLAPAEHERREAAAAYARRRRLGPFARPERGPADPRGGEKQLAALLRAGHDIAHARRVLAATSDAEIEEWIAEAREEEDQTP